MGQAFLHGNGGASPLNFKVVGGTSAPSNPKENTIWVNTDQKITSWHFGANEPNVYDVKLSFEGNSGWIDAPHQLSVGDILNFVVPATKSWSLEDINIRDAITEKTYSIRDLDGTAVEEWTEGIKVGVKISNNIHPIGNNSGYHGSAYLVSWGSYYNEEGMVWIFTGASSTTVFNALKKNGIQVYPIFAKQYVSGAWAKKDAKIYRSGSWQAFWDGTLYDNGTEIVFWQGAWKKNADHLFEDTAYSTYPKYEYTREKIDLTNFSKLLITGSCVGSGSTYKKPLIFGIASAVSDTTSTDVSTAELGWVSSATTKELNISSLTGSYYIFLCSARCSTAGSKSYVYKVWLE